MPGDPIWMHGLLAIHVTAGALCLILVPLVLAVTKGGARHIRWGKYYLWSMGAVAASAAAMAVYRPIPILALLAVLSFCLAFTGYRVQKLKAPERGGSASFIDWVAAVFAFVACAALFGVGVTHLSLARPQSMSIVAIVFGILGMRGTAMDIRRFVRKRAEPLFWLPLHIGRFLGSYIAAWTAFSAVTLSQVFPHAGVLVWMWPSAVGLCAILVLVAYYRRKFSAAVS